MWLKHLPAERVLKGSMKDNFWEMGDTGPCGPCTELHYDRIGGRNAASLVNQDDPDVLEVWNLVFIQFNREASGDLASLPAKHVDTGMGFERLVSVLQDKRSNYDTDVFAPLFDAIQESLGLEEPYTGKLGKDDVDLKDTAYRVLADHARTLSYAIADGAVPSNEGRGYVLRRVLRRAVRFGQQILKAPPGFFSKLIPTVVETYKETFPELEAKQDFIIEIIKEEEESFEKMLVGGIKYFNEVSASMRQDKATVVSGRDAFFLYDTMGFPVDLTQIMADEQGFTVDLEGFESEMAQQKARSRQAAAAKKGGAGVDLSLGVQETAVLQKEEVTPTDDEGKFVWDQSLPATVQAIYTESGFLEAGKEAAVDVSVGVVVDQTSFYAESGGQVGDSGDIIVVDSQGKETGRISVYDTQVFAGYVMHKGAVTAGAVKVGSSVTMNVDYQRRAKIAPNHSLTHVVNYALRKVLGGDVDQKGSLCDEDKLRFDFTSKGALTAAQLTEVEAICRAQIDQQLSVDAQVFAPVTLLFAPRPPAPVPSGPPPLPTRRQDGPRVKDLVAFWPRARDLAALSRRTALALTPEPPSCPRTLGPSAPAGGPLEAHTALALIPEVSPTGRAATPAACVEALWACAACHAATQGGDAWMRVQVVPLKDAMSINGLRAVFGEQYPDPVRVVAVGNKVSDMVAAPDKDDWLTGSVELCGGTHIKNTKEAHGFALVNEEASARPGPPPRVSACCCCMLAPAALRWRPRPSPSARGPRLGPARALAASGRRAGLVWGGRGGRAPRRVQRAAMPES